MHISTIFTSINNKQLVEHKKTRLQKLTPKLLTFIFLQYNGGAKFKYHQSLVVGMRKSNKSWLLVNRIWILSTVVFIWCLYQYGFSASKLSDEYNSLLPQPVKITNYIEEKHLWNPFHYHPNSTFWRMCVQRTATGFPKENEFPTRPVLVGSWDEGDDFIFGDPVSALS